MEQSLLSSLRSAHRCMSREKTGHGWRRSLIALLLGMPACVAMATTGTQPVDIAASVSPNPVVSGEPAKFTVSITAHQPATGTPTGTVSITEGVSSVCTVTLPSNNCTGTLTGTGTQSIVVLYNGDANFASFGISKSISVVAQTTTALASSQNPANQGHSVQFTATVAGTSPTGTMTFYDGVSTICGSVAMSGGQAACTTNSLSVGTHSITATYSGDGNNGGSTSAALSQSVLQTYIFLNQFGLTGTWYNAATSGQGFLLDFFPDLVAVGTGYIAGSWFTFDVAPAGGEDKQRWYTFSGNASAVDTTAQLVIYATVGGNFNAGPKVSAQSVGQATLKFADCGSGTFTYNFADGRNGQIPVTRLTPNITCGATQDNGAPGGNFLLSGAWYDPNTSGQGFLFEVNPAINYLAAAWYTFAPNGQAVDGGASQRWYTLQGPFAGNASSVDIYERSGGIFDNPATSTVTNVGSGTLTFSSCNAATFNFTLTGGSNSGSSGTINLQRLGPAPSGCTL